VCCICFDILFDYERYELVGGWKEGVVIVMHYLYLFALFFWLQLVVVKRCMLVY
jgi:hypothetical protein